MQYKTVTLKHKDHYKKKELMTIGDKYQEIISQHAACGWILLGIHAMPLFERKYMFWKMRKQVDILIFFREYGASGCVEPNNFEMNNQAVETMNKPGVAQNAMNFMKPQELAGKFSDLKNKAMSSVSGHVNNSNNDNNSNTPQE